MIVNRYPGKCQSCGIALAQGDGFAYKNGYKWFSVCKSSACHRRLGLQPPVLETKQVRQLSEDGVITMPYDRDAVPLIKSLPGAKWNPETKQWRVSIEPKDLSRVLEVCDQIRLEVPDLLREQAAEGTADSNEALDRAERIRHDGKALFPFQKKGVEFLALHDRALLADDMGLGKQQAVDTLVLTPNGLKTIGSLSVGDYVIGSDGNPTMVTGVFPQGIKPSYALVFSDGLEAESGPEHLWAVEYYIGGRRRHRIVVTTDQIRTGAMVETQWPGRAVGKLNLSKTRLYLPMLSGPVNFEQKDDLTIPPYTMGALLGNGHLTGGSVVLTVNTLDKDEFKSFIDAEGVNASSMRTYDGATKIELSGIINTIRELEVNVPSPQKRIPERYFFSSPESRIALLQGLMDTDGSCSKTRNKVTFHSTSIGLAQDVRRLVLELGGLATIREYDRTSENKPVEYQVRVKLPSGILPFRITRKAERYVPENRSTPTRSIKQIKYVRDVESVCISVAATDHLYACANAILTHNTVQSLVALPEGERVIVISPAAVKYNWADEIKMWRPDYKSYICSGKDSFKLPEIGEIVIINYDILPKWLAPTKDSGKRTQKGDVIKVADLSDEQKKSLSETTVIADECHLVKNYRASRSQKVTQLARACKRVWFMTGTPLMNRPQDLFGVLQSGDMHPLGNWYNFVRLFNGYKNQWGGYDFGMPGPEVPERMKRVMLRRLKTEVLKDLPPKTYQKIEVNDLGSALLQRLNDFIVATAVHEGLISADDVTSKLLKDTEKVRALSSKLEMTSLPSFEQFSEIRALLAEARIPAMLEEVESYEESDTPLIVFSAHKAPINELAKRDGWEIITGDTDPEVRRNIVHAFQNGKLKGVGLTIKAGGVGLTLTRASHALFVDLDWTPALNIQAEDRMCIEQGQLVAVRGKGYVPIEDVLVGDEVFTHRGRWRKVVNIHSKQNRALRTTIQYKRFSEPLISTHDHKHLVLQKEAQEPQWVPAHEILPGDFLVLPKHCFGDGLDTLKFPEELRHDPSQQNQFGVEQNNGRYVPIPDSISIDDEALFAFGYYIANGFSSVVGGKGRFVSWSAHKKNRAYLERIQRWLATIGVNSNIYDSNGLGIELRGYSIELASWFMSLFGRTAPEKHIPEAFIEKMSPAQMLAMFQGYLKGDGHFRNSQQSWTSVSPQLSMQLNLLTAAIGYSPCLTVDDYYTGVFTIDGKPSNQSLTLSDDRYVYNPVTSVQTEFGKKGSKTYVVYDLEVEEDESFLVGNAIVHNCRIGQTSNIVLIKRMSSTHPLDQHMQKLIEHKMELAYRALEASIKFKPIKPRSLAQEQEIIEESDEELAARIQSAEDEVNREIALGKLQAIAGREAAKVNDVPEPELTPGRKAMLREALDYMVGRCDGAVMRDGMGFNRPDAFIGHWLYATGLRDDDELPFRVLERILVRYRRQLKEGFEAIWKPDIETTTTKPKVKVFGT
jgi:intein/homing endonuclease